MWVIFFFFLHYIFFALCFCLYCIFLVLFLIFCFLRTTLVNVMENKANIQQSVITEFSEDLSIAIYMSQCTLALKASAAKSCVHRTSWCRGPKSARWRTALVLSCLVWLWGGCAALGRIACQGWSSWWPGRKTASQHMLGIRSTGSVHVASGRPLLTFSPHSPCVHGYLWSPLAWCWLWERGAQGDGRQDLFTDNCDLVI